MAFLTWIKRKTKKDKHFKEKKKQRKLFFLFKVKNGDQK